jgi:predicted lysophospholipase L1 biosynthesis ABC-type transport system permease subunit
MRGASDITASRCGGIDAALARRSSVLSRSAPGISPRGRLSQVQEKQATTRLVTRDALLTRDVRLTSEARLTREARLTQSRAREHGGALA